VKISQFSNDFIKKYNNYDLKKIYFDNILSHQEELHYSGIKHVYLNKYKYFSYKTTYDHPIYNDNNEITKVIKSIVNELKHNIFSFTINRLLYVPLAIQTETNHINFHCVNEMQIYEKILTNIVDNDKNNKNVTFYFLTMTINFFDNYPDIYDIYGLLIYVINVLKSSKYYTDYELYASSKIAYNIVNNSKMMESSFYNKIHDQHTLVVWEKKSSNRLTFFNSVMKKIECNLLKIVNNNPCVVVMYPYHYFSHNQKVILSMFDMNDKKIFDNVLKIDEKCLLNTIFQKAYNDSLRSNSCIKKIIKDNYHEEFYYEMCTNALKYADDIINRTKFSTNILRDLQHKSNEELCHSLIDMIELYGNSHVNKIKLIVKELNKRKRYATKYK
jgi:hypothetical protein